MAKWSFSNCISITFWSGDLPSPLMAIFVLAAGPQIRVSNEKLFSYFSTKTYVVGAQKNRLTDTVLLSTLNTCLN